MTNKTNIKNILIAAAWPYVNGEIHIGHLAGYFIPADVFARFSRQKGNDTLFVSGADCHGTPITVEADKRGISAAELVKEYIPKVHEIINLYGVSYELFTATTTENHKKVTQDLFIKLLENGYISKNKSLQYYSAADEKFLPDRYVEGECPFCNSKDQRADQCENCGRTIGLGELIEPYSKLTKSAVELRETEHYFIEFPKLEAEIKEFVKGHEDKWKDWVWKETYGFLNEGLRSRAITRDLDWGIEIPKDRISEDFQIENIEQKRFYVWFEAVIGYLSASIEYCSNKGKDVDEFWKNPDAKHYYFMGQDNLTFHTIFWPGQLIGQKEGYNLPDFPSIVKFLNANGQKLSKSRGNIIDAKQVGNHFSIDAVRFYIISILPENKEGNWDWNDFKNTINGDLVGNIGNFIHRTLSFYKNKLNANLSFEVKLDSEVERTIKESFIKLNELLEQNKFVQAIDEIKKLSSFGNQYFDHNKPWSLLVADQAKAEEIIFNCLQIVNSLSILLKPFIPNSADKIRELLGQEIIIPSLGSDQYKFEILESKYIKVSDNLVPVFSKIEDDQLEKFNT